MRPRLRPLLLAPGGLGLRFALDCSRRFFGLRSLLAVSSVASGRIEFVSRASSARQFYGLSFRFQLLSTPCRQNAVTFNSWRKAPPQRDFHPPMHALSQVHGPRSLERGILRARPFVIISNLFTGFAPASKRLAGSCSRWWRIARRQARFE